MDLRDIITGLFLLVAGNIVFYLIYPLYGSFIDGIGTAIMGDFGLTNNMVAVSWGGYIFFWIIVGIVSPIYLIIKGASKE